MRTCAEPAIFRPGAVQGGLPVPITTPAHGTAHDIAGKGLADVNAMANAFTIACRMGLTKLNQKQTGEVTA